VATAQGAERAGELNMVVMLMTGSAALSFSRNQRYNLPMNKKIVVILLAVIGILFLGMTIYYWITPANHLLAFVPGYDAASSAIHFKHGLGMLILAVGSWVLAWFQSASKPKDNNPASTQ